MEVFQRVEHFLGKKLEARRKRLKQGCSRCCVAHLENSELEQVASFSLVHGLDVATTPASHRSSKSWWTRKSKPAMSACLRLPCSFQLSLGMVLFIWSQTGARILVCLEEGIGRYPRLRPYQGGRTAASRAHWACGDVSNLPLRWVTCLISCELLQFWPMVCEFLTWTHRGDAKH